MIASASASVVRLLRTMVSAAFGLPDRLRHGARHAAARRRIAMMQRPRTLLVVCAGNICRSPYMEAVLRSRLPDVRIASAGLVGFDRPAAAHALAVSAKRGIDLSQFRSRSLEAHRARTADLIVVMEPAHARYLVAYCGVPTGKIVIAGDLDPAPAFSRSIADPWNQSLDVFEASFDRLDRCAATLIETLQPVTISRDAAPLTRMLQAPTRAKRPNPSPQPTV
jgi:protein-tyrosine phosphatase